MEIDFSSLTMVFNVMFKDVHLYQYMPNAIKEKNFFIINRYFSKRYPMLSNELNVKNDTNKCAGMDLIHYFMRQQMMINKNSNPQYWFWSKNNINNNKYKPTKEEELLMETLEINNVEDLLDLKKMYPDFIESEMEYVKFIIKSEK